MMNNLFFHELLNNFSRAYHLHNFNHRIPPGHLSAGRQIFACKRLIGAIDAILRMAKRKIPRSRDREKLPVEPGLFQLYRPRFFAQFLLILSFFKTET